MPGGFLKRPLIFGAVAGVVLVAVVSVGLFLLARGGEGGAADQPQRVLLVFECPDASAVRVAWVVLDVDLAAERIAEVDTSTTVSVQGTTYSRLRDAYSFGGGAGVAKSYSGGAGVSLSSIVVQEAEWRGILGGDTGVALTLEEPTNVFLGQHLVDLGPGDVPVEGASAPELLAASEFMTDSQAREVRAKVAAATAAALRAEPGALARLDDTGVLKSDLSPDAQRAFCAAAEKFLAGMEFAPAR